MIKKLGQFLRKLVGNNSTLIDEPEVNQPEELVSSVPQAVAPIHIPTPIHSPITIDYALRVLNEFKDVHGHYPLVVRSDRMVPAWRKEDRLECESLGVPKARVYYELFGSIKEARAQAEALKSDNNYIPAPQKNKEDPDKINSLQALISFRDEHGRWPKMIRRGGGMSGWRVSEIDACDKHGVYPVSFYYEKFGNMENARIHALRDRIEERNKHNIPGLGYTEDEINALKLLHDFYVMHGEFPKAGHNGNWHNRFMPSASAIGLKNANYYIRRFNSLNDSRNLALQMFESNGPVIIV